MRKVVIPFGIWKGAVDVFLRASFQPPENRSRSSADSYSFLEISTASVDVELLPGPTMEATFDNSTNVLNARIRSKRDESSMYSVTTASGLRGRKVTLLKDLNPIRGDMVTVGAIHWKEKMFEVRGQKKPLKEIKRREGRFLKS